MIPKIMSLTDFECETNFLEIDPPIDLEFQSEVGGCLCWRRRIDGLLSAGYRRCDRRVSAFQEIDR
jgi:hypothetical protein